MPGLQSSLRGYGVTFGDLSEAQLIVTLFYVGTFEHMLRTQSNSALSWVISEGAGTADPNLEADRSRGC